MSRSLAALLFAAGCTRGGIEVPEVEPYEAKSQYLLDPTLNFDVVLDTVDFLAKGRDDVNGGFYIYLDDDGNPVLPDDYWWGTTRCDVTFDYHLKTVFGQARVAYAFTRAFLLTGDPAYLEQSEHALAFLYDHGWDEENGGWFFSTDETGQVAPWQPCEQWDPNTFKWSFDQFYPLLGIAALAEVTLGASEGGRASPHWQMLETGLALNEAELWDDRDSFLGYYDSADLDWHHPTGKGFTGAADAISTHASAVALLTGDEAHRQRVVDLAQGIADHLAPTIALDRTKFGFVEAFDSGWGIDPTQTEGYVGHLMKAVWCLARAYAYDPRPELRDAGELIFDEVWENGGYDHEYGGIFQDYDWVTGDIVEGKNHWNLEQGFTGGITGYHLAKDDAHRATMLQMADESLDFFMTYLRDPEDGVAYTSTENDGTPDDTRKGHVWKAGYHDTEFGYYGYMYGSLYYTHEPITLHYLAVDDGTDHSMVLSPTEDEGLVITGVELDGAP